MHVFCIKPNDPCVLWVLSYIYLYIKDRILEIDNAEPKCASTSQKGRNTSAEGLKSLTSLPWVHEVVGSDFGSIW